MPGRINIVSPNEIEKKSFEMISEILGDRTFNPLQEPVIKRVIHATADFEYADILNISPLAVERAAESIKKGMNIVTDTRMAAAGINKKVLEKFGGSLICFMDDERIAIEAEEKNITRAALCMDKASQDIKNKIYVIGNAPTALIRLCELIHKGTAAPDMIIGVPVGFVNVVESKELLKEMQVPYILTEGRKGGSTVAAAIVNAILYMI